MRALAFALVVAAACGPKASPGTGPGGGSGSGDGSGGTVMNAGGGETVVTAPAVCDRILALQADHCRLVDGFELSRDECIADFERSLDARGDDARAATVSMGRCLLENASCEEIAQCVVALNPYADQQDGTPTNFRACEDRDVYAPVGLSAEAYARRHGAGVTRYRDHASTKDQPVEVCGMPAQIEWLMAATCDDGSRPFANGQQAHASRVGNVGSGGQCGSIIDLYEVPCPEGTYAIYIDAYVCPRPAD